jgi:hypothetical protein
MRVKPLQLGAVASPCTWSKLTEKREINTAHHQPIAVVLWREDNRCDRQSRRRYDKDGVLI